MRSFFLDLHDRPEAGPSPLLVLFVLAVLLAAGLLMGGCAVSGVNRGDVNLVSLQEEWAMGRRLDREVRRQVRVVRDPVLQRYVDRLGQRIAAQTAMRRLPWHFHVVDDPAINAFNIPGGHVYVNTGLLAEVESAAELAGVLAHEVSHGVARHGTERLTKAQGLNVGAGLLLGHDPSVMERLAAQLVGGGAMAKFSRDDEREADRLGIHYMTEAGYHPRGMVHIFERLLGERRRRPGAVGQFFATHPLTEDRIRDMRRQAARLDGRPGLVTQDRAFAQVRRRARRY